MLLPRLKVEPRVRRDLEELLAFIRRQPRGKPAERRREIYGAFEAIRVAPFARPVLKWVNGIGLRRYFVRQFAVIYAYIGSQDQYPRGVVSIRAIKHHRVRDVLFGVREVGAPAMSPPLQIRDAL
jgi:hypothetical protein